MSQDIIISAASELPNGETKKTLYVKKERAEKIIGLHVAGAITVGFSPIPFSDAPILLANQVALVNNIINVYERPELKELLGILLKQIGLGFIISQMAIRVTAYLTAQLLKILPGLGSITGGIVNGSIAGAITYGYGAAVNNFCYNKCRDTLYSGGETDITDADIRNFTNEFRKAYDKYSTEDGNTPIDTDYIEGEDFSDQE